MRGNVFRLIRIYLIEIFSLNSFRSKDAKTVLKTVGMLLLYCFAGVLFAVYAAGLTLVLSALGAGDCVFPICSAVSALLTLITVLFKGHSFLYQARDTEMLSAMPLRSRDFILARLTVLYLFELPFNIVLLLPSMLVYSAVGDPVSGFALSFWIGFLFLPVLPFFIGTALGVLLAYVSSRFRALRFVSMGLILAFLIGLICVLYNPSNFTFIDRLTEMPDDQIAAALTEPLRDFVGGNVLTRGYQAVFSGDVVSALIFALVSLVAAVLVCLMLFRNYVRFVGALSSPMKKKKFRSRDVSSSSPVQALFVRDLKRYFSSVSYVVNTLAGGILLLIASIAVFVFGDSIFGAFSEEEILPGMALNLAGMVPIVMCLLVGMSPTTAVSLSLEGKNFWILQTLPVSPSAVYFSKVAVCLLTTVPAVGISAVLMMIKFRPGVLLGLMFFLFPLIFSVFSAYWGLWLNSKFLRLDWTNETNIVKQSPSVMITGFSSIFPILFGSGVFLMLPERLSGIAYLALCVLFAGLSALLIWAMSRMPLQKLAE